MSVKSYIELSRHPYGCEPAFVTEVGITAGSLQRIALAAEAIAKSMGQTQRDKEELAQRLREESQRSIKANRANATLKRRIARLETDNRALREQLSNALAQGGPG